MKKFYRIIILLIILVLLSTFNPKELNIITEKNESLFKIKNIEIKNNILINKDEIEEKLNNIYEKNIFFLKRSDIEEPLKDLVFLEKVEVKRKYPNTVIIKVFETQPIAILFKNEIKYIIDSSSNLILPQQNVIEKELPSVFGKESEKTFINFFNKLKKNNFPIKQIKNFYFFQIGRWDLQLFNNKIIKFPHYDVDEAINKSIKLLEREDFKNYNIIDLRVAGKIIVE